MDPLSIVFGFLLGLLVYHLVSHIFFKVAYTVVSEPLPEEEVKRITNARGSLLENILDTLGDAWDVDREQFNCNMELLPNEVTLATVIYRNSLVRVYVDWNKKKIQTAVTQKKKGKSNIYRKSFSLYSKNTLENMYAFYEKFKRNLEQGAASQEKVEQVREAMVEKLTTLIENMVEEKVHDHLEKMLENLEQQEETDEDHE